MFRKMLRPIRSIICLVAILPLLSSCNSSGSAALFLFTGNFDVAFNLIVDECGLFVQEGQTSVDDQHTIVQTEDQIDLNSQVLPTGDYSGSTRSNDSFQLETLQEGNIFGDGVNCRLSEALVYEDARGDSAEVLYNIRIDCDDGFRCDSALRGNASRAEEAV